jgi:hypothetical protein
LAVAREFNRSGKSRPAAPDDDVHEPVVAVFCRRRCRVFS